MSTPPLLTTARLRLRPMRADDAAAVLGVFGDPEVTRYWAHPPLTDTAAALAWIEARRTARDRDQMLDWAITAAGDDTLTGVCFLSSLNLPNRRAEIGYALARSAWGQGHASEAVSRTLQHAFEDLALHRIEADVDPRNDASLGLLARFGFQREGHLRERWQATGEVQDSVLLGLLAPDWRALGAGAITP